MNAKIIEAIFAVTEAVIKAKEIYGKEASHPGIDVDASDTKLQDTRHKLATLREIRAQLENLLD